jgi:hypothetical protein
MSHLQSTFTNFVQSWIQLYLLVTLVLVGTIQQFSICESSKSILHGLNIALDLHKKIHYGFISIRFTQALYTLHLTAEHQNSLHINPLPPLHLQDLNRIN